MNTTCEASGERKDAVTLELREDEAKVLDECVSRRMYSLEESGLTDSYCYPRLAAVRHRLRKAAGEKRK